MNRREIKMELKHIAILAIAAFTPAYANAVPVVYSANADTPEELKPTVDAFRSAFDQLGRST